MTQATTTARDIRTAAENLAQSHAEYTARRHHQYDPDATQEERDDAKYWQTACINDGNTWRTTWRESGYTNDMRNGKYRARRIADTAAARYAQITGQEIP